MVTVLEEYRFLFKSLQNEINTHRINIKDKITFYTKVVLCYKEVLLKTKHFVVKEGFRSDEDEIHFFKEIKQEPLHDLIFYTEKRSFEIRIPISSKRKKELK